MPWSPLLEPNAYYIYTFLKSGRLEKGGGRAGDSIEKRNPPTQSRRLAALAVLPPKSSQNGSFGPFWREVDVQKTGENAGGQKGPNLVINNRHNLKYSLQTNYVLILLIFEILGTS